jgi:hypothetical protein
MKVINKNKIATICLILSIWMNPLGFDVLMATLIQLTGNYWVADMLLYCGAAFFLGLYFYFSGINPFNHIMDHMKNMWKKIKLLFSF